MDRRDNLRCPSRGRHSVNGPALNTQALSGDSFAGGGNTIGGPPPTMRIPGSSGLSGRDKSMIQPTGWLMLTFTLAAADGLMPAIAATCRAISAETCSLRASINSSIRAESRAAP
jgi:hypothetical protein